MSSLMISIEEYLKQNKEMTPPKHWLEMLKYQAALNWIEIDAMLNQVFNDDL